MQVVSGKRRIAIRLVAVALAMCVEACERTPLQQDAARPAKDSVREQLAQAQQRNGLSLAFVAEPRNRPESKSDPVIFVTFADRSVNRWKNAFPIPDSAVASGGALTADGNVAAFDLILAERQTFAIASRSGPGFREIEGVQVSWPYSECWSHDDAKLAIVANDNLQIIDPKSGTSETIGPSSNLTSECWSPDDQRLVYQLNDRVLVFDFKQHASRELSKGTGATWSPDGKWIAFRNNDTYYQVRPSGEGQRLLFKSEKDLPDLLSPLWWSPDSRVVAYVGPLRNGEGLPLYALRLRVRRLGDNSEDWVAEISGSAPPEFQWGPTTRCGHTSNCSHRQTNAVDRRAR